MQWYFSSILISCVIMNHRYILSAFHPRDFNSFDYGSLFHVQVCFAAQQHYLSKTGVFHDGWCCRNKEVIDHTWALLCKNHCFSLDSILHKQRHDWSHSRTSLQKLWSFVKLDVSKAKRWLIPQQHYLSKTLFFHLARGFLLWVACFASLHISILNKFNDLQLSSWPICCFLSVADLMTFPFNSISMHRKGFLPGINEAGWCMLWVTCLVNLCSGISVVYWFHVL